MQLTVRQALDLVEMAYAEARRLVFDHYPAGGVPEADRLSPLQREALERLRRAEEDLAAVRRDLYRTLSDDHEA
ncbi:MAG: hypothetical protein WCD35_10870 [Mycobacteriales bacterium]